MTLHTYEYLCYFLKNIQIVSRIITTLITFVRNQTICKSVENGASYCYLKSTYHYPHNVMGERAAWGKMAAMCGRSTPLAGNADETSSLYIYLCFKASRAETFKRRCWLGLAVILV